MYRRDRYGRLIDEHGRLIDDGVLADGQSIRGAMTAMSAEPCVSTSRPDNHGTNGGHRPGSGRWSSFLLARTRRVRFALLSALLIFAAGQAYAGFFPATPDNEQHTVEATIVTEVDGVFYAIRKSSGRGLIVYPTHEPTFVVHDHAVEITGRYTRNGTLSIPFGPTVDAPVLEDATIGE